MSYDTKNGVYVRTCPGCNEYYIGEPNHPHRSRVRLHKQHTNTQAYSKIPLSEYLQNYGNKQFDIFLFYKLLIDNNVNSKKINK